MKQEKSLFVKLAQCAVSAGLLYWIVSHYSISFSTLFPSLASPLSLVATLIISLGFIQILAAVRWRTLLASMAMKLPLAPLLGINVTAIFWGSLLPSSDGFAALRILIFSRRYPAHSATGAASVICEKIYGFFALFIWAIVGMAVLSRWHWPLIFASLIFIAFIYLLLLVLPLPGKSAKIPSGHRYIHGYLHCVSNFPFYPMRDCCRFSCPSFSLSNCFPFSLSSSFSNPLVYRCHLSTVFSRFPSSSSSPWCPYLWVGLVCGKPPL